MRLPAILAGRRRTLFAFLVANGVGQAMVATATALLVQHGFDALVTAAAPPETVTVALLAAAMLATIVANAWLRWRAMLDGERLGQGYVHAVRMCLFRHITAIGADGARQMSRGALMLRFVGDLTALRNWVSLGLSRLTVSGLATVLALGALAVVEPVIAAAVSIAVAAAGAITLGLGPRLRARTREARRHRGRIAALINDRIAHLGVVETFGQEQRETRRVRRASRKLRDALVDRARVLGLLRALSEASAAFAGFCALVVGAVQVAAGDATPGGVVAAMVVAGLLAPRLSDLGRVYEYWNAADIAREKQLQVLRLQPVGRSADRTGGAPCPTAVDRIELRRVSLAPLLREVDLAIEAGERVAIIGPNGAGKSTLLRMIAGIVEPDAGEIRLGGEDIRTRRWSDVRKAFAMVSPDLSLLRGSLRLNLTYGARDATDAEIGKTLQACRLVSLAERLPRGLDTRLCENGEGLSTGERARIAIARAVLARPQVLLLDEAEANLDRPAREAVDTLTRKFAGTVVFVTHDATRVVQADRVLAIRSQQLVAVTASEAVAELHSSRLCADGGALRLVS
jgi:ABC-type multidrug transport system fused ATPase/permease subunit